MPSKSVKSVKTMKQFCLLSNPSKKEMNYYSGKKSITLTFGSTQNDKGVSEEGRYVCISDGTPPINKTLVLFTGSSQDLLSVDY